MQLLFESLERLGFLKNLRIVKNFLNTVTLAMFEMLDMKCEKYVHHQAQYDEH